MVNNNNFSERLKKLLEFNNLTSSAFADTIGVQRSSISHLLSGRNNPSLDLILKILDTYTNLRFEWLVKGEGSMLLSEENSKQTQISRSPSLFDAIEDDTVTLKANPTRNLRSLPEKEIKSHIKKTYRNNNSKKPIKIVLLYEDGSFEVFDT